MKQAAPCSCGAHCVAYQPEHPLMLALLWHGRGPNEGQVLRPLAKALTTIGAAVAVPEWDSTSADRGRHALACSLTCAAERADGLPLVVAGWSLGGTAALSVALRATEEPQPVAVVGLAANVRSTSPLNGIVPLDVAMHGSAWPSLPMVLLHGLADGIVEPGGARTFVQMARSLGWRVAHREVDTDHAGVIGTEYDNSQGLCVRSDAPQALVGRAAAVSAVEEALRLAEPGT